LATRSLSLGPYGDLYQSNTLRRWRLKVASLNWQLNLSDSMDMGKEIHLARNGLNAGGSVEACPEDTTPNMGQAPGVVETSLTSRYFLGGLAFAATDLRRLASPWLIGQRALLIFRCRSAAELRSKPATNEASMDNPAARMS
jgi:hypothetical protein